MGGKTNPELEYQQKREVNKMLRAHLIAFINIYQNTTKFRGEVTKIKSTQNKRSIIYKIASEDLQNGRILVRRLIKENRYQYMNIRHLIEELSIPQLKEYQIGLGSATTRTANQKILANKYTRSIIRKAKNIIVFTDGSINHKDNPMTEEEQIRTGTGYGGYGSVIINKNKNKAECFITGQINTNDAQKAELEGILNSTKMIQEHNKRTSNKQYTILCDCRNAVKYINDRYTIPKKYNQICQQILEQIHTLRNQEYIIEIDWIPGHTENKWNDKADTLAKIGASSWRDGQPPVSRALQITHLEETHFGEYG